MQGVEQKMIGVDFDNTIVSYDELLYAAAWEKGLISEATGRSKKEIRDAIRALPDGEIEWQKLQAYIYGKGMQAAKLISGVEAFFDLCRKHNIETAIVSHKSQFASMDTEKVDLRETALAWMENNRFFRKEGLGLDAGKVYFEPTRAAKINRIKALGCTHFIDDLEETFVEADFPGNVEKILFSPQKEGEALPGLKVLNSWEQINSYFFQSGPAKQQDTSGIAQRLLNKDVARSWPLIAGRNSRCYAVETTDGKKCVLKFYFRHANDPRDRGSVEYGASTFLWKKGIRCVPEPIARDVENQCAVYAYVEGKHLAATEITKENVDTLVFFLDGIQRLRADADAAQFGPASEACFSIREIIESVAGRLARFDHVSDGKDGALKDFFKNKFIPLFEEVQDQVTRTADEYGFDLDQTIDRSSRILSPSDLGFHNTIMDREGRLTFLDFEYFGWDDPAKLIVDFVLHPGRDLSSDIKEYYVRRILDLFADDATLRQRVRLAYPLFGLKWCLILLNEFLKDDGQRRVFASADAAYDVEARRKEQLAKAHAMYNTVQTTYRDFPYDE